MTLMTRMTRMRRQQAEAAEPAQQVTFFDKVRALLALRTAFQQAEREMKNYRPMKMKNGISTTEFWIVAGFGLADLVMTLLDKLDGSLASGGLALMSAAYTIARGMVKAKAATPAPAPSVVIHK